MRIALGLILLAGLGVARPKPLWAQDVFDDVEYVAGKDGFADKAKGTLVISAENIVFKDKDGKVNFNIPAASITEVTNDVQIRDASVGKKLLFGNLAGSRKQEFIQLTAETAETAEGVVFKVKQGTSVNVMAKIKFAVKKAKGGAADTGTAAKKDSTR